MNKVMIIGTLGRDPEVRTIQSGNKVANLSVATTEKWRDKATGERKEKTEWHRVVIWGHLAGVAEQYLGKGSQVYLGGKLETRKWTDQSGAEKYSTEIIASELKLLSPRRDQDQGASQPAPGPRPSMREELDDSIPF